MTPLALFLVACVDVPAPDVDALPQRTDSRDRIALIIHGSGDDPDVWAIDALTRLAPALQESSTWSLYAHDWSERARDRLSAAELGLEEGEALGKALAATTPRYTEALVVAHSAGAFVAHGLVESWRQRDPDVRIHVVLLDPFGLRSWDNWVFGEHHFGEDADFAQSYMNTDDGAPTTDTPLRDSHNVDVTAARPSDWDPERAHWWPIEYWLRAVESAPVDGVGISNLRAFDAGEDLHERFPRGDILTP